MNERIKQLAVKAGLLSAEANGFDPTRLSTPQQKFAELIISECANLVDGYVNERTRYWAGITIREHFGAEE